MSETKKIPDESHLTTIFAVRTTIGREKSVQELVFNRLRTISHPVPDLKAILTSEHYRGYVFIEAIHQRDVIHITNGVPHVKGKVVGSIPFDSIGKILLREKVTNFMEEGDIVEVTSGIFSNTKAQVIKMPKEGAKEEVTVRLMDSDSPITVKIHADYLKLIEKAEEKKAQEYIISSDHEISQEDVGVEKVKEKKKGKPKKEKPSEEIIAITSEDTGEDTEKALSFDDEVEEEESTEDSEEKIEEESEDEELESDDEDAWAKFMNFDE